ncbi:hypothetical protein L227DRAFT_575654 [Lentinus tigrinus ALCF2SS1-6]|uniref:Uncharacterized protein n=1 Tax=Lentinus tigrinus ALCF2SS1-6 TaxID=1328759 RepID=A0A5C2SAF9_9APHY|nr:hypothetical protein L227DRAFT_575654 [Lentinus tigrinus ALCF2SS1-6]
MHPVASVPSSRKSTRYDAPIESPSVLQSYTAVTSQTVIHGTGGLLMPWRHPQLKEDANEDVARLSGTSR